MKDEGKELKDVRDVSSALTMENKRYVIAVANALLFSQKNQDSSCELSK